MKNVQTSAKRSFVTHWVIGSFIGWILGALTLFLVPAIWEVFTTITYQYYRESVWYKEVWSSWLGDMIFSLLALGGLFLMVVVMGIVQWQIALKGKINKRLWVFSTVLSITLGAIALIIGIRIIPPPFSFHPGNYSGLDDTLSVNDTWFMAVLILGGFLGFAMGIPKWLFFRSHFYKTPYWLLADIATGVATLAWIITIVSVLESTMISATFICCTVPIVWGTITGLILYSQLQRAGYAENE